MKSPAQNFTILMANDDEDECFLVKEALHEVQLDIQLHFVEDGEKLLDYLCHRGRYVSTSDSPRPDLILLDLNMPRKDGREALAEIKANPNLRQIPVVILTTAKQEGDIFHCYDLGVNSFIIRPITFNQLVALMQSLCHYWFEVVSLIYW